MVRKLSIPAIALSAFSLSALFASAPSFAAGKPAADPMQRVAEVSADLRARIATEPARAAGLRLELARIEALRGTLSAERRVQGGVLSAEQQARALSRLEAIARTAG